MIGLHEQLETALSGRYQIERELGQGGMAIVYLARDLKHGRRVAVKVLRPEPAISLGAERFLREINVAAGLSHPNIVPLYDSGEAEEFLYYVMPYVEGESLRDRLERERQLPIDEGVAIARQVADALDYAHARGVVHRDIKPENILLRGNHAMVMDFGLARALYTASNSRLTRSGTVVGTPAYMSPEQAAGGDHLDGRSDVYALACVVFETVAGVPPFRGATAQAVIAHHVSGEPPSLRSERSSCPPAMDEAVRRALAKTPADRFRTAGDFVRALTPSANGAAIELRTPAGRRPRRTAFAVAGVLAVIATLAASYAFARLRRLDQAQYLVLPFASDVGARADASEGRRVSDQLSEAVAEWRGVGLVERQRTRDELQAHGGRPRLRKEALAIARRLGAGRLLWGDVSVSGDSTTVRASLYDVGRGTEMRRHAITHARAGGPPVQKYRELASALLRGRTELPWTEPTDRRPASLPAWVAYDSARDALAAWKLADAQRHLRRAASLDPGHAQAHLWLAQVLTWDDDPQSADERRRAAARAVTLEGRLVERDAELARALRALADSSQPQACVHYRRVLELGGSEFAAWLGIGDCHARDSVVVTDRRLPSGYAFRGSYHSAARAYLRALEALPPPHPSFPYRRLAYVLFTQTNGLRIGHLAGVDTAWFGAYAGVAGDTLAMVPYPFGMIMRADPRVIPASMTSALAANKRTLRAVLTSWSRSSPDSPDAHERLGRLLEVLGVVDDEGAGGLSALAEVRRARALAPERLRQVSLAVTEVRLLVKSEQFDRAKEVADSVLRTVVRPPAEVADSLVGLAALTGRLALATALMERANTESRPLISGPDGSPVQVPPALASSWTLALVRSSFGVCDGQLRDFQRRVDQLLESYYADEAERTTARNALLARPMSLAVPCNGPGATLGIGGNPGRLVVMQQALARRDTASLRAQFDTLRVLRRHDRPGDIAPDYTFMEAWILAQTGDTAAAIRRLDLALNAPTTLGVLLLLDAPHAGGLVRAMVLRAELADRTGDAAVARRWARAVATLWSDADGELQSVARRMRALGDRP